MNMLQLVTSLSSAQTILEAVQVTSNSNLQGAKDIYLAWGKERGETVKTLNEVWKEAAPKKATGGAKGFAADYYDWLAEAERTEAEAKAFIMGEDVSYGETSKNTKAHLTHYLNIWALAETVRSGTKVQRTEQGVGKSAATTSKKAIPLEEEPVKTSSKELKRVLTSVAKGEYKTVTVVRNQLKALKEDGLEAKELDNLWDAQEIAAEKGIKMQDLQSKVVALLNK